MVARQNCFGRKLRYRAVDNGSGSWFVTGERLGLVYSAGRRQGVKSHTHTHTSAENTGSTLTA